MRGILAPDWRWRRVLELAAANRKPGQITDGGTVCRAWRFLTHMRTRTDWTGLWDNFPDVCGAYWIRTEPDCARLRSMIEAGVLARQESGALADYFGIAVEKLQVYEALFFDVRARLDCPGYVAAHALAPRAGTGPVDEEGVFLKRLAYEAGWDVARALWEPGVVPTGVRQLLRHRLLAQVFVNALRDSQLTGGVSARSRDTLAAAIAIMAREGDADGTALDPAIEASLQGLLDSIKITMVPSRTKLPAEEARLQPVPSGWGSEAAG